MSLQEIHVDWMGDMAFSAAIDGHSILLDASEAGGGKNLGPRPKNLMLVALAGCTGMDVVSILKKMRINAGGVSVRVAGSLTEEHPKHFTSMHIIYEIKGKDLELDKLQKAVDLSLERYCGVSAAYRKAMEITHEIRILDD